MKKTDKYPDCPFEHHDCFARRWDGKCFCLDNTDFGKRDCPFYKPESKVSHDIIMKKYEED